MASYFDDHGLDRDGRRNHPSQEQEPRPSAGAPSSSSQSSLNPDLDDFMAPSRTPASATAAHGTAGPAGEPSATARRQIQDLLLAGSTFAEHDSMQFAQLA
ncbi:hypothetical protein HK405_007623, partial [Cladochytrium tenue]